MKTKRKNRSNLRNYIKTLKSRSSRIANNLITKPKKPIDKEDSQISEETLTTQYVSKFEALSLTDLLRKSGEKYKLHMDDQIESIFVYLLSQINNNILIIGEEGTGKEALVKGIAEKIVSKDCPEEFFSYDIILIEATDFSPSFNDIETILAKVNLLTDFLNQNPETIVYIRNIYRIVEYQLLDFFLPLFKNTRIIGTITPSLFNNSAWGNNPELSIIFRKVYLWGTKRENAYDFLENQLKALQEKYSVQFPKDVFDYMVDIQYLETQAVNLIKIIESAEISLINAKLSSQKEVSKDTIMKNQKTRINFIKKYNTEQLRYIAYHEAGHVIAGLEKGKTILGVEIIPTDSSLGLALSSEEGCFSKSLEQLKIDLIYSYGGIVGAELFGYNTQNTDQDDIRSATQDAVEIVTKFEMSSFIGDAEELKTYISENSRDEICNRVQNLLVEAKTETKRILSERKEDIRIIAEALLKRPVLLNDDIHKLLEGTYDLKSLHSLDFWTE